MDAATQASATLRAVASVGCVIAGGVLLVHTGNLSRSGIASLSLLVNNFFLPVSLFVRMGGLMTLQLLQEMWLLPVCYLLVVLLNGALSQFVLLPIAKPPDWFRPWFVFTASFPNMVGLPLVFLSTICHQVTFELDGKPLSPQTCTDHGQLYLYFATVLTTFAFWIVGPEIVARTSETAEKGGGGRDAHDDIAAARRYVRAASGDNLGEGLVTTAVELTRMQDVGAASARTDVDSSNLESLEAAEAAAPAAEALARSRWNWKAAARKLCKMLLKPPTLAQLLALPIALTPALKSFVFSNESLLQPAVSAMNIMGAGLVPGINLVLAGTLGHSVLSSVQGSSGGAAKMWTLVTPRTMTVLLLGRMLLLPAASFAMLALLQPRIFSSAATSNKLMMLTMFLSACTPTASRAVVLLQGSRQERAAEAFAFAILGQYAIGAVSMTAFLLIAFRIIGA